MTVTGHGVAGEWCWQRGHAVAGAPMAAARNEMLTRDYEYGRPGASPVELELHTRWLIAWPTVIIQVPPVWDAAPSPGITDISEEDH